MFKTWLRQWYTMFSSEPVQCWQNRANVVIFLVLVRTLAAVFWTICSLFIKRAEQPPNKALQ